MRHRQVAGDADKGIVAVKYDVDAQVRKQEEKCAQHRVGPIQDAMHALLREKVLQVRPSKNGGDNSCTTTSNGFRSLGGIRWGIGDHKRSIALKVET